MEVPIIVLIVGSYLIPYSEVRVWAIAELRIMGYETEKKLINKGN